MLGDNKKMIAVEEITLAIEKLPRDDFWSLTNQIIAMRETEWDNEMVEDARPGSALDRMASKALEGFYQGKARLLA